MRSDHERLCGMLDAIDAIRRHTAAGRPALDDEIIGQAAGRVSDELRAKHTALPWTGMISMRNRLVHGYFEIDADRVWDAVELELPRLREQLVDVRAIQARVRAHFDGSPLKFIRWVDGVLAGATVTSHPTADRQG